VPCAACQRQTAMGRRVDYFSAVGEKTRSFDIFHLTFFIFHFWRGSYVKESRQQMTGEKCQMENSNGKWKMILSSPPTALK
jgi:hypothetical protein